MAVTGSADTQQSPQPKAQHSIEVESVKCASCGFTEDCTPAYIARVRERFNGRWICGLCMEAVKDEVVRSDKVISTEEALNRHINVCKKFRSLSVDETEHPIFVMGRVLRRSLDSPKRNSLRTSSSSNLSIVDDVVREGKLVRSESCFPALSR